MSRAQELKKLREKNGKRNITRGMEITDTNESIEEYYENILTTSQINEAVNEYSVNMNKVSADFKEKTKLQDNDIAFLGVATLLQCARIYLVNYLTNIEKAGSSNRNESKLHDLQDKVLGKMNNGIIEEAQLYYSPLNQIITRPGVPYDATAYDGENYGLFKGANHRFSTLGHDPVFGLVIGTCNILTNTITSINKPIITTHHVRYDSNFRNPKIGQPASTLNMFKAVNDRFKEDKTAIVAAVIKQLIHIATDMYTPCGIQLPGANLILSKENVEKLTKYISTGDVVKVGASAGISLLINTIISAIHGCKIINEEKGDFSKELFEIRTRKIILYSNLFATSSNVIATGFSGNIKNLDIGGFAVTAYRLFNDEKFINKIKYEYLNSQVSKIYQEKMINNSMYYE